MNYAIKILENGVKEIIETRNLIVANAFPHNPIDELIKLDYQIENIKNVIQFEKTNTRKTKNDIIRELSKTHGISTYLIENLIKPSKFGKE